jgi:hypothetical protein
VTSARHLFCYAPQRAVVVSFLHDCGSTAKHAHLKSISQPEDLEGHDHITFMVVKGRGHIPKWLREGLHERGALVIEVTPGSHRLYVEHLK